MKDGYKLGQWVAVQRFNKNKIPADRLYRLNALEGWTWDPTAEQWDIGYFHLLEFAKREGHTHVPKRYVASSGFKLGTWVMRQKQMLKRQKLIPDRQKRLEEVDGWVWSAKE